jgi:phage portal protein BeeE
MPTTSYQIKARPAFRPSPSDNYSYPNNPVAQIIQRGPMGPFGQNRTQTARMVFSGWASGLNGMWSADSLEQVRHWKHWVYVCGKCIANVFASDLPKVARVWQKRAAPDKRMSRRARQRHSKACRAYRRDPESAYFSSETYQERPFLSLAARRKALLSDLQEHEELEPLDKTHPLVDLLHRPNPHDSPWEFYWELYMFLHLAGSAFIWLVPGKDGRESDGSLKPNFRPVEMWIIPSHWMWPRSYGKKNIDWYEMRPFEVGYATGPIRFEPEEIIYIRDPNPQSKLSPYSPLAAGAEWIDTEESIETSRYFSFKNGAWPGIGIELGEQYDDPDDAVLDRMQAKFMARLQGEMNVDKPFIVPPGAKLVPLTITPREMIYKESADGVRDQILSLYGISKTVIGFTDDVNFASAKSSRANFFDVSVNPHYSKVGQSLTAKLAPRFEEDARIWWPDRAPDDPAQLTIDLQTDYNMGAITINEVRAVRGREPYPHGGDDPMLNIGTAPQPWVSGDSLEEMPLILPTGTGVREDGQVVPVSSDDQKAEAEAEVLSHTGVEPKVPKEQPENKPALGEFEPAEMPNLGGPKLPKKRLIWAGAANGKLLTREHVAAEWERLLRKELDGES